MPRDSPSPSGTSRRSLPPWRRNSELRRSQRPQREAHPVRRCLLRGLLSLMVPRFERSKLCRSRFSMPKTMIAIFVAAALISVPVASQVQKPLDIHFIDVEGGQATLVVSPSGESMLVDTGWPGFDGRDADRIVAAARQAGVSKIDYLVITHYHTDHAGGVPQLAARMPVRTFVDHGPTVEQGDAPAKLFTAYTETRAKGRHLQVKPGDKIPIAGVDVQVVAAGGEAIAQPVAGAGAANPLCAQFKAKDPDPS